MSSVFQHKIPFPKSRTPKAFPLVTEEEILEKNNTETPEKIAPEISILVLAAGNSSRLRQPKQLVLFNGKPLICHLIEQALFVKMHSVFVVLGGNKALILPKTAHLPVIVIDNKNWEKGMGSSISIGVQTILEKRPKTTGIVTILCDQPFVSADLIYQLIATQQETQAAIVAAQYAGDLGVPAFFDKKFFPELMNLQGKKGAKKIIQNHFSTAKFVSFPEGIFDIDTPADLLRVEEWSKILQQKNKLRLENISQNSKT